MNKSLIGIVLCALAAAGCASNESFEINDISLFGLGQEEAEVAEAPQDPLSALGGANSVPEGVYQAAGPRQDVASAFLNPSDNCYWYIHSGPVENTPLPLKASNGAPICAPKEQPIAEVDTSAAPAG